MPDIAKSNAVRVVFVRHAETEWNRAGRYQGCIDTHLSQVGRDQASALAERLRDTEFAAIYSSHMARSVETAEFIAQPRGLPLLQERAFAEVCHGKWEGLTVEEVEERFPELVAIRRRTPEHAVAPEGESLFQVRTRALHAFAELLRRHEGESLLLVGHDAPTKMILLDALGLGPESFWKLRFTSTGVSEIIADGPACRIVQINDIAHLGPNLLTQPHRAL